MAQVLCGLLGDVVAQVPCGLLGDIVPCLGLF